MRRKQEQAKLRKQEEQEQRRREQFLDSFGKNIINFQQSSRDSVVLVSLEKQTEMKDLEQVAMKLLPTAKKGSILSSFITKFQNNNKQQQDIYCIDLGWINQQEKKQNDENQLSQYAQKIQYLQYFLESMSQTKMSVYLCLQYKKKYQTNFQEQCKIPGNINFGAIFLESKQTNLEDFRKVFISQINEIPEGIKINNFMIDTPSLLSILGLEFLDKNKRQQIFAYIKKMKGYLENYVIELLEVPRRLLQAIIKSKNNSLPNISDLIKTNLILKGARDEMIQESVFRASHHDSSALMNKISSTKMKELYFLQQFIEQHRHYVNSSDFDRDGKEFLIRVFEKMRNLSDQSKDEIDLIIFEANTLLEHTKRLDRLVNSSENHFFSKNIIGKCKQWAPSVYQLLKIVSRMQILENQTQKYYEEFQKIITIDYQQKDFPSKQIYSQIKAIIDSMKIQVKIFKNYFIMRSNRKQNLKEICKAIQESLENYENLKNDKEAMKRISVTNLLKNIADCLRNINKTRLALEIYQKLKFFIKIEECVMEIMMDYTEDEKVKLLVEISEYFRNVNELELSKKYAQMVYEIDPTQVNLLIENKLYCLMSDRTQGPEAKILKEFNPQNSQNYTSTPFSKNFLTEIADLEKTVSLSQNYEVKIKKHVFQNLMKTLKK